MPGGTATICELDQRVAQYHTVSFLLRHGVYSLENYDLFTTKPK
jgi:hypothetical protein